MRSRMSEGRRAACFGIAAAWTGVCAAQVPTKNTNTRRVGILWLGQGPAMQLEQMLRDLSTGGMQVAVEARFGMGGGVLEAQAASLVANKVDLIFAQGTPAALVAQRATTSIPIVYTIAGDPVELGLAATLSRPGGNSTGVYTLTSEVSGKRVSLLREAVPRARASACCTTRVPSTRANSALRELLQRPWAPLRSRCPWRLFSRRFAEARSSGVDAISVLTTPILFANLRLVADLALQNRVPTIAGYSDFATSGARCRRGKSTRGVPQCRRAC